MIRVVNKVKIMWDLCKRSQKTFQGIKKKKSFLWANAESQHTDIPVRISSQWHPRWGRAWFLSFWMQHLQVCLSSNIWQKQALPNLQWYQEEVGEIQADWVARVEEQGGLLIIFWLHQKQSRQSCSLRISASWFVFWDGAHPGCFYACSQWHI